MSVLTLPPSKKGYWEGRFWATDIITHSDGSETRTNIFDPGGNYSERVKFKASFKYETINEHDLFYLENVIRDSLANNVRFPLWYSKSTLSTSYSSGASSVVINESLGIMDFSVFGSCIIFSISDVFTYEILDVDTITTATNTIGFETNTTLNWSQDTLILPLITGTVKKSNRVTSKNSYLAKISLDMEEI